MKIDPTLYLQNQQKRGSTNSSLGKDDFLKILMAQIQNQNPLDPMKDKEFVSQMTQFSSLEQMTNMSQSFQAYTKSQSLPPIIQYSSLIGKEITYPVEGEGDGTEEGFKSGIVQSVKQKEGKTAVELPSGETIPVEQITKVSQKI
ncbi:flagellar hook assembly protein FlgD [Halobacillus yeomjeoni]|uniref:Flagellar hook assembly protein FlgD n=1 Tax=Halobacillus yeomjeoni TaxID=311194 RepID=A0A931MU86_9BACI|nr:flagellar hook assembly protein FlgD [Halobacillus yeomjeoni]MBH0229276.1 flagellar hook assembly protein FlgD [Halobacillus yeomjeoni]MCA0983325.1 flagellar hook assembly protein FlgD [Halobacillus yeomjeoni]